MRYGKAFLATLQDSSDRGRFVEGLEKALSPGELGFLALILTLVGEAHGQASPDCRSRSKLAASVDLRTLCVSDRLRRKNLLLLMKIMENRSEERRFITPDVVGREVGLRIWGALEPSGSSTKP